MRQICGLLVLPFVIAMAGCTDRPRAPALRNDPVYENPDAGLRFLTPSNWTQQAKADLPSGPVETERLLVRYSGPPAPNPPSFDVAVQDLPDSTDLVKHLSGPSHSMPAWRPEGKPEALTVNGAAAVRYVFTQRSVTKETVAFRRSGRVYFFNGIYATADAQSRDQIRQLVQGVTWTK